MRKEYAVCKSAPSYKVCDGLQWDNNRGLRRFTDQLRHHLSMSGWKEAQQRLPRWRSSMGKIALSECVEPWSNLLSRPNVIFYPHNVLPTFLFPSHSLHILVLHDLLFLEENNRTAGNQYRAMKLRHSIAYADLIITVSQASRQAILGQLKRNIEVRVVPNALPEQFAIAPWIENKGPNQPVKVFHFGGTAPTKNTLNLMRAISRLRQQGHAVRLQIAAMSHLADVVNNWRRELALGEESIEILPQLPVADLVQSVANADIHCMPSTGEGFGIPVIEAARVGTLNVLSPLPVFREILGDSAIYAEGFMVDELADAILRAMSINDENMRCKARATTDKFLFEHIHEQSMQPVLELVGSMLTKRLRGGLSA